MHGGLGEPEGLESGHTAMPLRLTKTIWQGLSDLITSQLSPDAPDVSLDVREKFRMYLSDPVQRHRDSQGKEAVLSSLH